jgi:hypothetical protein
VDPQSTGTTRRWQLTIAIVAVLSLFSAVIAGWAERSQVVVASPLQWAASSQATPDVGVNVGQVQIADGSQPASHLDHRSSSGASPINQKPFKSGVWMTRDRPPTEARLAPQLVRSPWPVSFVALGFQPGNVCSAAAHCDQDILTQLCVARR